MLARKCDRCGQLYEKSERVIDGVEISGIAVGQSGIFRTMSGMASIFGKEKNYDLCNDCLEEFEDWLILNNDNPELLKQ